MSDTPTEIPEQLRPDPQQCEFDLNRCLDSIVSVHTIIPDKALTASMLGTERSGHGVVIGEDGLVLTIGYLVTEAESVMLVDSKGSAMPGYVVGYDQESGFGLIKPLGTQSMVPVTLGDSELVDTGNAMVVAGAGGLVQCLNVSVEEVREFAGYWEYLLDAAIITSPAHPSWGGAALFGTDGKLYGLGSLILHSEEEAGLEAAYNLFIPVNLLTPIVDDLVQFGRRSTPARPWMGWYVQEGKHGLAIVGLVVDGPAATSGLEIGDIVLAVSDRAVLDLPGLYRAVWDAGAAGVDIEVLYERGADQLSAVVTSVDRNQMLHVGNVH